MDTDHSIQIHDQTASDYDRIANEYGYCFANALFGLCYEYLQPGQRLLDIGIGTGLSSIPFSRAGLAIYGLDGSAEMLRICQAKNITAELKQWDLRITPWPYADGYFDHIVACGLYHFIPDLEPLFEEVARLVRPQGIYAFTTKTPAAVESSGPKAKFTSEAIGGVEIYAHTDETVHELITGQDFVILKALKFLQSRGIPGQYDTYAAFVCRRGD